MNIVFKTTKLRKECNEEKRMMRVHGPRRAKVLKLRLAQLKAAETLSILGPPYKGPGRCHELVGEMAGLLSVDLDGPYRLIFAPADDPPAKREDGGLDWSRIQTIEVVDIKDTHG